MIAAPTIVDSLAWLLLLCPEADCDELRDCVSLGFSVGDFKTSFSKGCPQEDSSSTRLSPTKLSPMRLSPTRLSPKKLDPKSSNFGPSLKKKLKEELKEMVWLYDCETKRKRQKLRPHGSFSAEYWSQASDLALHLHDCTLVKHELSSRETGNDTTAERLPLQVKALQTESRLYQQQVERLRMEPGDIEKVNSRVWMLLFTTSQCGLQINSGIGERDSNEQTAFRKELLTAYDAENPGGDIWDPIIGDWFPAEHCIAAHIFPYRHGQEVMTTSAEPQSAGRDGAIERLSVWPRHAARSRARETMTMTTIPTKKTTFPYIKALSTSGRIQILSTRKLETLEIAPPPPSKPSKCSSLQELIPGWSVGCRYGCPWSTQYSYVQTKTNDHQDIEAFTSTGTNTGMVTLGHSKNI
ncbi:hypothetical protein V8E54_008153 [Elaphomyces granulatus]